MICASFKQNMRIFKLIFYIFVHTGCGLYRTERTQIALSGAIFHVQNDFFLKKFV